MTAAGAAQGGSLAALLAGERPSADAALRIARALVEAVAARHAAGAVHGAIHPAAIQLLADGTVALGPPAPDPPELAHPLALAAIPYLAPERLRGGAASRRSDLFETAAVVEALLCGPPPSAPDPLEAVRRALYEPRPVPAAIRSAELRAALAAARAAHPWRRSRSAGRMLRAVDAELSAGPATLLRGGAAGPGATAGAAALLAARPALAHAAAVRAAASGAASAALQALRARLPGRRAPALLAVAVITCAAAFPILRRAAASDPADEVAALVARGDLGGARTALEAAADRLPRPLAEKLRADIACARGAPVECARRYRAALSADPSLRADPVLRRNARALLARAGGCRERRAAADLLALVRDPDALPALRQAKRSAGLLGFLCTGDTLDRAIRASLPAGPG